VCVYGIADAPRMTAVHRRRLARAGVGHQGARRRGVSPGDVTTAVGAAFHPAAAMGSGIGLVAIGVVIGWLLPRQDDPARGLAADAVVLLHACSSLFVAAGALLLWRWPRVAWLHAPAALWGGFVEWSGTVCPLTPLENRLRLQAGRGRLRRRLRRALRAAVAVPAGLTPGTQGAARRGGGRCQCAAVRAVVAPRRRPGHVHCPHCRRV
jgi:hypothetical protein